MNFTDFIELSIKKGSIAMSVRSIRREIRFLRYYALSATVVGGVLLLGAAGAIHKAHNASFDTLTVHKIVVKDRQGKLAMVLTNHDDPMPSIFAGKKFYRNGGEINAGVGNEIIFYNRLGNEQGGFVWDGVTKSDGTYGSSNVMSYDTVTTDSLLQVHDGNDNGKMFSFMTGWNRPNMLTPEYRRFLDELSNARNDASKREAIRNRYRDLTQGTNVTRYLFGYDQTNTSQVMLADAKGRPRIKMFVTPDGQAKLDFLDAGGKVTAEYPKP